MFIRVILDTKFSINDTEAENRFDNKNLVSTLFGKLK